MLPFYLLMNQSSVSFRARLALCSRKVPLRQETLRLLSLLLPLGHLVWITLAPFSQNCPDNCTRSPETARTQHSSSSFVFIGLEMGILRECAVGIRVGYHQTQTEAVQFMVFLHHPALQATGSNVLLSKVPLWWRNAASAPRYVFEEPYPKLLVWVMQCKYFLGGAWFSLACFGDVRLHVLANRIWCCRSVMCCCMCCCPNALISWVSMWAFLLVSEWNLCLWTWLEI